MAVKCIVHMHITADLKAYWLACLTCICSNVEFISNVAYIYNVAGIFSKEHMSLM